jgi:hypothetical protein
VLLWCYRKQASKDGDVFFGYLLWYGAGRMFIEGLRNNAKIESTEYPQLVPQKPAAPAAAPARNAKIDLPVSIKNV